MPPSPILPTRWAALVSIATVLAMLPNASMAQAYKCTVDGKVVYQQAKCNGGESVNTSGAGKGVTSAPGSVRLQQEVAVYKRREAIEKAVSERRVLVGMTSQEVLMSWGQPTKINKTASARGASEQWIYRKQKIGDDQYVYVENGVVRTIQTSVRQREQEE
jgi:hypothetical protein